MSIFKFNHLKPIQTLFNLLLAMILIGSFLPSTAKSENGYQLWLRYKPLSKEYQADVASQIQQIVITSKTPTMQAAERELNLALPGMLQRKIPISPKLANHTLVVTTANQSICKQLGLNEALKDVGNEGYLIRTLFSNGKNLTVIAANTDAGALYGTFALLRLIQTEGSLNTLNITEKPSFQHRLLNHWDNLDGTVERGYAGHSIWWEHPLDADSIIQRHIDYARTNASIGINGTVLNNVNATPQMLTQEWLQKVVIIANRLRPYNIKVYLSINFSSPKVLGNLSNSDPLNPQVAQWWKDKADEIYGMIPDFGGFLVKANSEGLPGPQDYGRTHADGANMLADALKPHGGIVMWRAFVYNPLPEDRAKQAYNEFTPLDGQFRDNVIVQVKNGPIDFQPREPLSPLFGAMEKTSLMMEFQITQEYMGHSNHMVFLAPMYKESLETDTWSKGQGSTVAKTLDGSLLGNHPTAIAGVANIGYDTNWCGHQLAQANWYAYGRLAWNHDLTSDQIAREWASMTFSNNPDLVEPLKNMLLTSHETCVNYMTPLGLHHIMAWDHHYGPEPWCTIPNARPDWLPSYYHRADSVGLGFDRSSTGSNAVAQYREPVRSQLDNLETCPEKYLLWFHHVNWNDTLPSGQTLWLTLVDKYYSGAATLKAYQRTWDALETLVDAQRFHDIQYKLKIQARDAIWWRDACLLYFQTFSKQPIPLKYERPLNDLNDMKKIKLDMGHHN